MSFTVKDTSPPPKIERSSNNNWLKGTVTAFDSGRTPIDGLVSSDNIVLDQNGTVRPRPSLRAYGPEPVGTILGEIYEFKKQTGLSAEIWMISLQNVEGTTKVYIARGEDEDWTECDGKTYDNTAKASFLQIQNKVLVMNGVDNLSYLNIPDSSVVAFTSLTTPSAPTLSAATGLSGTSFKVYYAVTANSTVGETAGSAVLSQSIGTDRDLWNPTTQSVQIQWTTVTNVRSWNVYMGVSSDGAGQPTLYLIASGIPPDTLTFKDDGTRAQDLSRPLPTTNSTAGPKASYGHVVNSRVWLVGDSEHPYYVWRGGDYGFEIDFSPANGGGYSSIGNGTKEVPNWVGPFRSGGGESRVTVLTKSTNGSGRRFFLSPETITYGSTTFVAWRVDEDSGSDGTDSPAGVVIYNNSLFYPSRDGFKTTGTRPQLQNVLSTDRISNTIQRDISRLNTQYMKYCVGVAHEGRIYWTLPVGSTSNNEIWVLDLDREGAWTNPWRISADWIWKYNDNSGVTHLLVLSDNKIYELSYSQMTNDAGTPFITSGRSGLIYFTKDGREWGKLLKVVFTIIRPRGAIGFDVTVKTDEGTQTFTGGETFRTRSKVVGWGEPSARGMLGWGRQGWSEVETIPEPIGEVIVDYEIEIDEEAQWWQYGWSSNGFGVSYQISNVVGEFVNVGLKDLD